MSSIEKVLENHLASLMECFEDTSQYKSDLFNKTIQCVESVLIQQAMQKTNNNQTKAAELLGLNRSVFCKKLKKLNHDST